MYKVGFSRVVIDYPMIEIGMMGYGIWKNRVKGKATEIHSRAISILNSNKLLVFVNVEIASISYAIRREVLRELITNHKELNISEDNLMLTAQHTHSAPSGYSEYAYYNFTTPGFRKQIFDAYVHAIVKSVVDSYKNLTEAVIKYKKGKFNDDVQVAWNRSIKAYNANPENEKILDSSTELALDRNMYVLQVENLKGKLLGSVNWFGVHATSIGNDNTKVSFDNKGYASKFLEESYPNTVHIFAQGKAGDISPHFHGPNQEKIRRKTRKQGDHGYAKQNGEKQFVKAKEILNSDELIEVSGNLGSEICYKDFTKIDVDKDFADGNTAAQTSDACIGLAFFKGTPVDGKGISNTLAKILKSINKKVNKKRNDLIQSQGNKEVIVNASAKEILGRNKLHTLPSFIDFSVKELNKQSRRGALKENSLVPTILPLQLFVLGNIAIIGLPGEITTTAGYRLEKTVKNILLSAGIKEVILSPYANSYMGYITTKEEYDLQLYEGGHTIFGRWTLAAFQTEFKKLCTEIITPKTDRNIDRELKPPMFSEQELDLRTY